MEPTYEELEPGTAQTNDQADDRLEPTYEELERDLICFIDALRVSLEPTYEELEPAQSRLPYALGDWVWSLPMRNWNCMSSLNSWMA